MKRAFGILIALLGCSDHTTVSGSVTSITLLPFALNPPFSPSITDYYIRCTAPSNAATLVVDYTTGETQTPMVLTPDQEISVVGQYWIRCLPIDFPVLTASSPADAGPTPGYYLVDSLTYAFVLDTHGTPVWYARGSAIADVDSLTTNTISFAPNSTLPYGYETDAGGVTFNIDDLTNNTTSNVVAVGAPTDQHELRVLPNGDYILLSYPVDTGVDLTGLATFGPNETMADCEIQEVSPQGNLVWSWRATDHIDPVKESLEPQANVINGVPTVDVFHCNSVDVDTTTGNLLLSSRHANAVYYIDKTSGLITWKLGGTAYSKDGAMLITVTGDSEGTFSMQHDVRFGSTAGHVTMYDDHGAPNATGVARGIEYAVDTGTQTATVVFQSLGSGVSLAEGSFRRYADGHSVIAWGIVLGDARTLTEIDENGLDVFDVTSSGGGTYRAIKVPLSQLDIGLLRSTTPK